MCDAEIASSQQWIGYMQVLLSEEKNSFCICNQLTLLGTILLSDCWVTVKPVQSNIP